MWSNNCSAKNAYTFEGEVTHYLPIRFLFRISQVVANVSFTEFNFLLANNKNQISSRNFTKQLPATTRVGLTYGTPHYGTKEIGGWMRAGVVVMDLAIRARIVAVVVVVVAVGKRELNRDPEND